MNSQKIYKMAYGVNVWGRLALGVGCGVFIRKAAQYLTKDATLLNKMSIWGSAVCVAVAAGHAIDCYVDGLVKQMTTAAKMKEDFEKETNEANLNES